MNHCYYISGQTDIISAAKEDGTLSHGDAKELLRRYPDAKFMLWDEASEQIEAVNEAKYLDILPTEITREVFQEMLGVMPPWDWHNGHETNSFLLQEAQTGNVHPVFVRIGSRYFKLFAKRGTKHSEMCDRIKATFPQL